MSQHTTQLSTTSLSVADDKNSSAARLEAFDYEDHPSKTATSTYLPDLEQDHSSKPQRKSISFWLSFVALNCTTLIVSLDATALSVAIPKITQELKGTTLEAFWTNIAFILAQVIAQPIYTTVSDVLGRKIPLYNAFILFLVGSIVFALAPSMPVLITGRVLQGLGGGGLDVLGEVILADITTLKERPFYLGLYALPMAAGGVCGPLIGAAFSEYVDWRWIGWINLPIIAVGMVLTFFFLHLRPLQSSFKSNLARLDWIGMGMFSAGCILFTLPISWAGALYPWASFRTIVPLVLGVLILVGFALYESRPAYPVFPYRIFSNRTANVSLVGAMAQGALLYTIMLYVPIFFQAVKLESPFRSAVSVLPAGVFVIFSSVFGVVIIEIVRRYRWTIISNHLLMTLGTGLWALWHRDSSDALLYGLQVIPCIGVGTLFMALNIPMTASVKDPDDMGLASGILVSFRLFGATVGLAMCSTVFNSVFEREITDLASRIPLPPDLQVLTDVREAIGFVPVLQLLEKEVDAELFDQILSVYRNSIVAVFFTLTGIAAVAFGFSWLTKELTIEREELGRQQMENA